MEHPISKQKHFHTAFAEHTLLICSLLSSTWSSCVLRAVAQITPEFPEHYGRCRDENDVVLYHICNGLGVYGRSWFQVWGTNLCENLLFFSCLGYPELGSGLLCHHSDSGAGPGKVAEARANRFGGESNVDLWILFFLQQCFLNKLQGRLQKEVPAPGYANTKVYERQG